MTQPLTHNALVAEFRCLGDKCEDTCCQNWSMLVDEGTLARYKADASELLANVDTDEHGLSVMKRDPVTRFCVKLDGGICSIHKERGENFLGDACHFYPRATRKLGNHTLMTASASCPEVVRLALALPAPFTMSDTHIERLPHTLRNYLPKDMHQDVALRVHEAFIACAMDNTIPPDHALARISNVARSLDLLDKSTLDAATTSYLRMAEGRLPKAQSHPADLCNLLHALSGLIVASHKPISDRLQNIISDMERTLAVTLDWQNVLIETTPESAKTPALLADIWRTPPAHYTHALRRYLALQLSLHLFPFAGLGGNASERITFIGVRYAMMKLAIGSAHLTHGECNNDDLVRIIQSLSRFLDHLGDANFSLAIFNETGWTQEPRLLSLLQIGND